MFETRTSSTNVDLKIVCSHRMQNVIRCMCNLSSYGRPIPNTHLASYIPRIRGPCLKRI